MLLWNFGGGGILVISKKNSLEIIAKTAFYYFQATFLDFVLLCKITHYGLFTTGWQTDVVKGKLSPLLLNIEVQLVIDRSSAINVSEKIEFFRELFNYY